MLISTLIDILTDQAISGEAFFAGTLKGAGDVVTLGVYGTVVHAGGALVLVVTSVLVSSSVSYETRRA